MTSIAYRLVTGNLLYFHCGLFMVYGLRLIDRTDGVPVSQKRPCLWIDAGDALVLTLRGQSRQIVKMEDPCATDLYLIYIVCYSICSNSMIAQAQYRVGLLLALQVLGTILAMFTASTDGPHLLSLFCDLRDTRIHIEYSQGQKSLVLTMNRP